MKYISLTFKNIKKFIVYHPVMFILFILVQIICCVAAFITCGMANNMYYVNEKMSFSSIYKINFEKNSDEIEGLQNNQYLDEQGRVYGLHYGKSEDADPSERVYAIERQGVVPINEIREKIIYLLNRLSKYNIVGIDLFLMPNNIEYIGKFTPTFFTLFPDDNMNIKSNIQKIYINSNEKIIVGPTTDDENGYQIGKTYEMNGYEYKCVADCDSIPFIPYNALDDDFRVYLLYVSFEDKLTQQNIDELTPIFNSLFGEHINDSYPPEPYDPIEVQLNQMVYVISLVVMVIILLAIAKFYNYVLSDRKNTLTILRLCGCTRGKVHIIYMLEIFLTMIVTSATGFILFKFVFFKSIAELYPSFKDFYTDTIYWIVLVVYIVLAMVIMAFTIIPSTKATITDMKRKV